jgi:1-acyl-sn-glycerol-3-phosphate acyltransferase
MTVMAVLIAYGSYLLSQIVFWVVLAPLVLLLTPFPRRKYQLLQSATHRYLALFTRTWLPVLGVYRIVEISGLERALTNGPSLCVANHRGFMDGLLLLGLVPRTGVLIKSRQARRPLYGFLERHFDLVAVERGAFTSVAASMNRCRGFLGQGKNLLVFPEGGRARNGRLQPFQRLAFELALATGTPAVPVVIHSTQPFMAKVPGSFFPKRPNLYRIRFLEPEHPRPDDDGAALCDRVYKRMSRELKLLDAGTCWERGQARCEPANSV